MYITLGVKQETRLRRLFPRRQAAPFYTQALRFDHWVARITAGHRQSCSSIHPKTVPGRSELHARRSDSNPPEADTTSTATPETDQVGSYRRIRCGHPPPKSIQPDGSSVHDNIIVSDPKRSLFSPFPYPTNSSTFSPSHPKQRRQSKLTWSTPYAEAHI